MRARSIKPGLVENDVLAVCGGPTWKPWVRLLFTYLPMIADRMGRLEDRPAKIKKLLFGYDDELDAAVVGQLLDYLDTDQFIKRYVVDGQRYIQITKFLKHQNPYAKEKPSVIPPIPDPSIIVGTTRPDPVSDKSHTLPEPVVLTPDSGLLTTDSGPLTPDPCGSRPVTAEVVGSDRPPINPDAIFIVWNDLIRPPIPKCKTITPERREKAKALIAHNPDLHYWRQVIRRIMASPHCTGANGWFATIDWFLEPENSVKVMEGNYDDHGKTKKTRTAGNAEVMRNVLNQRTVEALT